MIYAKERPKIAGPYAWRAKARAARQRGRAESRDYQLTYFCNFIDNFCQYFETKSGGFDAPRGIVT